MKKIKPVPNSNKPPGVDDSSRDQDIIVIDKKFRPADGKSKLWKPEDGSSLWPTISEGRALSENRFCRASAWSRDFRSSRVC